MNTLIALIIVLIAYLFTFFYLEVVKKLEKETKIYKKSKIKRFCWNNDCLGNYSRNHKYYFYNFLKQILVNRTPYIKLLIIF